MLELNSNIKKYSSFKKHCSDFANICLSFIASLPSPMGICRLFIPSPVFALRWWIFFLKLVDIRSIGGKRVEFDLLVIKKMPILAFAESAWRHSYLCQKKKKNTNHASPWSGSMDYMCIPPRRYGYGYSTLIVFVHSFYFPNTSEPSTKIQFFIIKFNKT